MALFITCLPSLSVYDSAIDVSLHRVYAAKQADRLTCMVEKHGETDTDIHAHKQESADCLAAVSIKFLIRILCPVLPRISAAVMEGESRAYIL